MEAEEGTSIGENARSELISPVELLQISTGAAALALALGALLTGTDPGEQSLRAAMALVLLVAGLVATFGAMIAFTSVGERLGLPWYFVFGVGRAGRGKLYNALACLGWTLVLLALAHAGLIIDTLRKVD